MPCSFSSLIRSSQPFIHGVAGLPRFFSSAACFNIASMLDSSHLTSSICSSGSSAKALPLVPTRKQSRSETTGLT